MFKFPVDVLFDALAALITPPLLLVLLLVHAALMLAVDLHLPVGLPEVLCPCFITLWNCKSPTRCKLR